MLVLLVYEADNFFLIEIVVVSIENASNIK